ncbi:MAG: hypothetical protein KDD47_27325, partial [Acidobacteria bacterium]|nr:hypothetical protein [Acidobacteriota bacterium]
MGKARLEEGTPGPGERRVSEDQRELEGFDRRRSAGLFVGIGTYQDENLASIPFAVDDAVDLAHLFLVELQLIHESHTVLCLAGRPRKEETAEKLRRLEGQGVEIRRPLQTEIYTLLERLGGRTNSKGLFLVAVASHGVSFEGADYLLAEDSQRRRAARTGIAVAELFDEVAQARAPRQIVLLDACRDN